MPHPLLQTVSQRYYDELANGGYKGHSIDEDLWDIKDAEELLNQIKTLPGSGKGRPEDLNVLKKVLVGLSDFAAAITFSRNNPNFARSATIWSEFNRKFLGTISNLQNHSRRVDEEVDITRLTCKADSAETLSVIASMQAFLERSNEVSQVRRALDPSPTEDESGLKVLAIHGLGGHRKHVKMSQAVANLASKLGLPRNDTDAKEEDMQVVFKVKDWLNSSGRSFLLIFDNVDDINVVLPVWPSSSKGSILIPPDYHLSLRKGPRISYICNPSPLKPEYRHSRYEEFLRQCEESTSKIHARGETPQEYNHTLSTVWAMSLEKLPPESENLLSVLVFFDPDLIPERLFTNPRASLGDDCFEFLLDEFEFGDAVSALMKLSFINRSSTRKSLSIHRLVQTVVLSSLSKEKANLFLTTVVELLSCGFPNTWHLIVVVKRQKLTPESTEKFAELVFRVGTYLWETEQPTTALELTNFGLSLPLSPTSPTAKPALRMLGHIFLDVARPKAALDAYQSTLSARLKLFASTDPQIADVYDSIACAYTEIGNVPQVLSTLETAKAIHMSNDPTYMARRLAIYAMIYLQAGKADEALLALRGCWELQGMTETQIAASRYPKHSGDIVLLARIYHMLEGRNEEALQLASKTILIRKGILGNKGPRVADSMFIVAGMLLEGEKRALA
ncbi:hypothetical protein G7Y89_g15693 [Cudoniella acicularis]|uniref:DUF7779 domain-containing protein n=1 Tax=Cudoniella acicularis TaxID=354080 RepID=A0A8H4QIE9_9HELO|nr:hypothetical protein G7Y89_g15693 [Cudoniella acicularis]